jgi:hypothetical protein
MSAPNGTSPNTTIDRLLVEVSQSASNTFVESMMEKTALKAISKVSSDSVFSDETNWKLVSYVFKHSSSSRRLVFSFRSSFDSSKKTKLKPNMKAGDRFELQKIIISKSDRSHLVVKRSELSEASSFDFDLLADGPSNVLVSPISLVSQLSQNSGIANIGDPSQYVAQSFEFQSAKTVSSIDFYLRKAFSSMVASTIKMEILKESDFSLLGTSDEISLSAITAISPQAPNAVKFTFPNVALQANVRYLAKISIVNAVDISISGTINVVGDTSNPYPYGNAFSYAGGSLNNFPGIDYMFEIFGQ